MNSVVKNSIIRLLSFIVDVFVVAVVFTGGDYITGYLTGKHCFCTENLLIAEALVVLFFFIFDLYATKEGSRESTFISVVLSSLATSVCGAFISIFAFERYSLEFTLLLIVMLTSSLAVWRLLFSVVLNRFREKRKILILESSTVPTRLARKLKYSCTNLNEAWYYIVDEEMENEDRHVIDDIIPEYDTVFISEHLSEHFQSAIFEHCLMVNKTVNLLAIPSSVSLMGGKIYQFADTPVIELGSIHLMKYQRFMKRAFDLFVAIVGLIVSSPFYLIIPILIKLDSEGPVFYAQERYTINKKRFMLYKFRTMRTDAEKDGEKMSTLNDNRITRVGNWLRKLRLDELPQFLNILTGSMSVVGPRPERPVFADEFCDKVRYYNLRYTMKAGLTGYAQIYGKYNTRVSDKILMDLIYAIKYSFWLDIKMVILTVKTMFIKESTEGLDEESERILNTTQKEIERKMNNAGFRGYEGAEKDENIVDSAGV